MADDSEKKPPSKEALRQLEIIGSGAFEILPQEEMLQRLQKSLDEGKPLRVKYGADPSAPDLHIGHAVPIRKLRQFQDLGHQIVFIIGDFTAMIGDPSGKSETRKRLTPDEVRANTATYSEQLYTILDYEKTEVVYNSAWLAKLDLAKIIDLAARYTVARMLERDDFEKRFRDEQPIYIHEFLYPLMQAYDSVVVQSDIEIGGTDQKFNLLLGREIQREMNQSPQMILTLPLLVGTDGVRKMSKSLGNYIGLTEPPQEIYGKTMSIPDEVMADYLRLGLNYADGAVTEFMKQLSDGELHPRDLKARIARELVLTYHGSQAADEAQEHFNRVFREKQAPEEMPEVEIQIPENGQNCWIVALLVESGLCESNRQARKSISAGSVRLDGERIGDENLQVNPGEYVLQVGKRSFRKVKLTTN